VASPRARDSVYLDHAATTPMRPGVVDAMLPFLTEVYGNPSGAHAAARAAKTALEEAREQVAAALGADPDEVVFTSGGTEADGLALKGAAHAARAAEASRDRVVVSAFEHKAVLASAARLEREGFRVIQVAVDRSGIVDLDALVDALDERVAVVSVMSVNNEVGTVQPLTDVAHLVGERSPHAVLHTDAVQAAPWVDVAGIARQADLVTVSAHKLGGPKGTGALVVRRGTRITAEADGGGQERGLRSGTVDVAGAVGFAAALRETTDTRSAEVIRVSALRDRLTLGLLEGCPGAWCNGDRARKVAGNVNIGFPGVDAQTLLVVLDTLGVCASSGSSCSSGAIEPSHVLLAMGLSRDEARASVRLTLGWSSTDADVDAALEVIPDAVARVAVTARHA
jgi:cysteine desulfurase